MATEKLQYQIDLTKTGTGGTQSAEELQKVQRAAAAVRQELARTEQQTAAAYSQLARQTGLTLAKNGMTSVGMAAAAATSQVAGLSVAFTALSTVMMALPTEKLASLMKLDGLAALARFGIAIGGIASAGAAAVGIGVTAVRSGSAIKEEEASQVRLAETQQRLMLGLVTEIELRKRLGRLTAEQAKSIEEKMLADYYRTGDTLIRGQALSNTRKTLERESKYEGNPDLQKRAEAMQKLKDLEQEVMVNSLEGMEKEITQAAIAKGKRIDQAKEWALNAGLTAEQSYQYLKLLEDEFQQYYKKSRERQAQEDEQRNTEEQNVAQEMLYQQMEANVERQKGLSEGAALMRELQVDSLAGAEQERQRAMDNFTVTNERIRQQRELKQITDEEYQTALALSSQIYQNGMDQIQSNELIKSQDERRTEGQRRIRQLEADLAEEATQGSWLREARIEEEFRRRMELYQELYSQGQMTEQELARATQEARTTRGQVGSLATDIKNVADQGIRSFSGGLASAFVAFASGAKTAGEAFKEFAANFLTMIAQMIMQAIIFRMVSAAIMSVGWGGTASGAQPTAASQTGTGMAYQGAVGGYWPKKQFAEGGVAGVGMVSAPTFFPRFDVLAGEAGSEYLTVLSKPRAFSVGGYSAVSGSAAGNQVSMMQTSDLLRAAGGGGGGGGGKAEIVVRLAPGLQAEIVNASVEKSMVQLVHETQVDGPVSAGIRGLSK